MLDNIIGLSIRNKLIVTIGIVAVILIGSIALKNLSVDAVPDVTNNQVVILTQSPTLAAQEVEQYITAPLEQQMGNLQGIQEIRSTSRLGLSVITLVFEENISMLNARQLVSEQIKLAESSIPSDFGMPELAPTTTGLGEIYQYTLVPETGYTFSLMELRTIQDWIVKKQLTGLSGVVEVSSFGGFVKQYEVSLLPEKMQSLGLSITEVYDAVNASNANTGGSYIEHHQKAYFIRGQGAAGSMEDIEQMVVKIVNGVPILVKDLATVKLGHAKRYGAMTRNGKGETVGGIVLMLKGANSEKTINGVKERIERIQSSLPKGLKIEAFIDRTKLIDKTIKTVKNNLLEGGLIVIAVLILLIGSVRAGILVASVIPLSMLITFSIMHALGMSANLMNLGALDFGLIVDGSIIVVESVLYQLHTNAEFKNKVLSTIQMDNLVYKSAVNIRKSATFGVIIILVVYMPLLSLTGIEGKMFKPMAITVSLAILSALALSLTYVPMMAAWFLRGEGTKHFKLSDTIVNRLFQFYNPLLIKALANPKITIFSAVGAFVVAIVVFLQLGGEFIPTLDEGDIAIDFQTPSGSSLTYTIESSVKAQKALMDKYPEMKLVIGRIGASEVPTDPMPVEMADLIINMASKEEWTSAKTKDEFFEKIAETLEQEVPGTSVEITQPIQMRFNEMIAGAKSDIVVKIFGTNIEELAHWGEKVEKIISKIDGVANVKIERTTGLPQIVVAYNRQQLAMYGLRIADANRVLKTALAGETAGVIFEEEKRFDLVVRLDSSFRSDLESIRNLKVSTAAGQFIPLSEIATIDYQQAPAQISRENGKRKINLGISVINRDVESLVAEVKEKLKEKINLPSGYYFEYGGSFENLVNAKKRLGIAVPVALMLIFVLLYFTFGSLRQSLMIFTAIPLAAIGGIFALLFRNMAFSISAGVGFIALFGVAVLNGIVLLSYLNQLESEGIEQPRTRVLKGVEARFRPVILTALVASLGFLPMAISSSAGAEVQKPLATVVIGGLVTSTLLTLLVLPVLYLNFSKKES